MGGSPHPHQPTFCCLLASPQHLSPPRPPQGSGLPVSHPPGLPSSLPFLGFLRGHPAPGSLPCPLLGLPCRRPRLPVAPSWVVSSHGRLPWESGHCRQDQPKSPAWQRAGSWEHFMNEQNGIQQRTWVRRSASRCSVLQPHPSQGAPSRHDGALTSPTRSPC